MGESIRVLHVDDEPDFAELTADLLVAEDSRFSVEVAMDADGGTKKLHSGDFDCVVSDYDMPGENGIGFLERVQARRPDLPFILFTGKGSEEVASEAISAGVSDYLQKEVGMSQYSILANRITNLVEQHRSRQAADETERRLQTLAETSNDVLWLFTADWRELLFVNSPYEDIWGRPIDELREQPRSFLEGVHPDDRSSVEEAMRELSTGEPADIEYRVNADEDYSRWVWVQGEPIYNDEGEVVQISGFARDVTDRKEGERALKQ